MKVYDNEIEIYFDDLNEEAQRIFLEAMNVQDESEGNYEVFPIAVVPLPEEDENEEHEE